MDVLRCTPLDTSLGPPSSITKEAIIPPLNVAKPKTKGAKADETPEEQTEREAKEKIEKDTRDDRAAIIAGVTHELGLVKSLKAKMTVSIDARRIVEETTRTKEGFGPQTAEYNNKNTD